VSELVNLKRARKARARAEADAQAARNRIFYGRTKADKSAVDTAAATAARSLDGHKREP
jgi:hypothetical protein